jgi:hypothetical protein
MSDVLDIPFLAADGRIPASVWTLLGETVSRLPGKRFVISLKEVKRKRSLSQNSFYRGPFIEAYRQWLLGHGTRLSGDQIHEGLKRKHAKNGYTITLPDGSPFEVPPSTTRFTPMEMEEYLAEIRAEYAPYGFVGPSPNELTD